MKPFPSIHPSIRLLLLPTWVALFLWATTHGQPASKDSANYLQSFYYNGVGLIKTPCGYSRDQWLAVGGSLVFAGSVIVLDEPLNLGVQNWNSNGAQQFGNAGDIAGGLPVQLGLSTIAALAGHWTHSDGLLHFGLDNFQSQIFTGGITLLVKNLFHRARPETGEGPYSWYGPFNGWGNESYFSGHTALAFSTANMAFLHSGKKWWVGVLGFGSATAIGLSRMQQQKHWASDVVMGALVGTVVSNFVYKAQQRRRAARSGRKMVRL